MPGTDRHRGTRRQLEDEWRRKLEEAARRYHGAAAEYRRALEQHTEEARRGSLASDALMRCRRAESEALADYTRVLKFFTDLTIRGKLPEEDSAGAAAGRRTPKARVISVVDDDGSVREATESLLRSVGYQVRTFASAENLLESGVLGETGCLLLDVRMPGIDGMELQRRLAAEGIHLPIIFMSAYDDDIVRQQVLAAGAVDLLRKPFAAKDLLAVLERVVPAPVGG